MSSQCSVRFHIHITVSVACGWNVDFALTDVDMCGRILHLRMYASRFTLLIGKLSNSSLKFAIFIPYKVTVYARRANAD